MRDYRNPLTGLGVVLSDGAAIPATDFLVHECGCLRYRNWNHRDICSPYWRVHVNLTAGNSIVSAGQRYALTPDVAVLTPAGTRIDTHGPRTPLHSWIHFVPVSSFHLSMREPVRVSMPRAVRAVHADFVSCFAEPPERIPRRRLHHLCQALLHGLFAQLDTERFRSYPAALSTVLVRIETSPEADLSTTALARIAGMSRSRFIPWFSTHLGVTPATHVRATRARLAAVQLCLTDRSIEAVAAATGFADRFHFSRVFRDEMGCPPATYRRQHRGVIRPGRCLQET